MTERNDLPRAGTITAIETQRKHQHRMSVFIDGAFAFGAHSDILLEHHLSVGDRIDAQRIEAIIEADELRTATEVAIRALTSRLRSEREIRDRLRQKGFAAPVTDRAIEKLRDWRYLDDAEFAQFWVENRDANRPRGARLLEQELRFKGVDRATIEETVRRDDRDELAGAMRVAEKKWPSLRSLPTETRRQRLTGLLARRGYGYDTIREVLKRLDGESVENEQSGLAE
jgi:regulatory protein